MCDGRRGRRGGKEEDLITHIPPTIAQPTVEKRARQKESTREKRERERVDSLIFYQIYTYIYLLTRAFFSLSPSFPRF